MDKSKLSVIVLKSATAVVCCIAVMVAGSSIASKICANREEVANISSGGSSGSSSVTSDDFYQGDSSLVTDDGSAFTDDGSVVPGDSVIPGESANGGLHTSDDLIQPTVNPDKVITVTSGLNSTDKAEVLKYYQLVMTKNEKDGLNHNQSLTFIKLDGGSGGIGKFISMFEPFAKEALAKNSNTYEGLPGVHDKILVSDWASAKAVNDGRYTTVTVKPVEQTDGPYGKLNEGTVGRSIGVLDGVAVAVAQIDGLNVDFQTGKLFLHYRNPQITIKVDNKTGSLVKGACSWGYRVYIDMQVLPVSMAFVNITLHGAEGIVDMKSTY